MGHKKARRQGEQRAFVDTGLAGRNMVLGDPAPQLVPPARVFVIFVQFRPRAKPAPDSYAPVRGGLLEALEELPGLGPRGVKSKASSKLHPAKNVPASLAYISNLLTKPGTAPDSFHGAENRHWRSGCGDRHGATSGR